MVAARLVELVLFATIAHHGLVALLMYTTFMSKLFEASVGFVRKIKLSVLLRQVVLSEQPKLIEKTMRSLMPMQSYLGYVNYVEKSTPFVMTDFCVTQIVNLLLVP